MALAVVQIAMSIALLAAVARLLNPAELGRLFHNASPFWLTVAFLILVAQQVLTAERWRLVASALAVPPHTFSFYMFWQGIGSLCSMVLPSIIGADLARSYALSRRTVFSTVIRVILVDRALGLLALAGLVILAFVASPMFFIGHGVMLIPVLIALSGVAIYVVLTRGMPDRWSANPVVSSGKRFGADLRKVTEGRGQAWCIVASVAIHVLSCSSFVALGRAINLGGVGLFEYFEIVPAALFATVIPFSIGGWGLRESFVIVGFGLVGVGPDRAFALSVMFGVLTLLAGFVPVIAGMYLFFEKPRDELIEALAEPVER